MSCSYHSLFLHLTFGRRFVSAPTRRRGHDQALPFLSTPTPILSPALSRNIEWCDANGDAEHRSIVGCNVIIPRGVCGRVSNLGAADAAYICVYVCVYLCIECNKVYNTRSDISCVRRTDRTSAYPRALFKITGDWFSGTKRRSRARLAEEHIA